MKYRIFKTAGKFLGRGGDLARIPVRFRRDREKTTIISDNKEYL
jgi:hypothetical protein